MSQEQIEVKTVVQNLKNKGYTDESIIDFLCSIIKQQMTYGGTLHDKLVFWNEKIKSIEFVDRNKKPK